MYDLTTQTEQRLTQTTLGRGPIVTADRIVWGDYRDGSYSLYEYNFQRVPHEQRVPTSPIENFLASFGPYVTRVNRNDQNPAFYDDVYLYNFATSSEVRLTNLPAQ